MIIGAPPTSEVINFDFWFEPDYWLNPPMIDILVDDVKIDTVIIDKSKHYQFTQRLEFGNHQLKLRRYNKSNKETRINHQGGYDTQSMMISKISIDGINLRNIVWDRSEYYPCYPEPWATEQIKNGEILETKIKGELIFGHNGTWVFDFCSPFYQFMVDCVRTPI